MQTPGKILMGLDLWHWPAIVPLVPSLVLRRMPVDLAGGPRISADPRIEFRDARGRRPASSDCATTAALNVL